MPAATDVIGRWMVEEMRRVPAEAPWGLARLIYFKTSRSLDPVHRTKMRMLWLLRVRRYPAEKNLI